MPDLDDKIDWNDEKALSKLLRYECKCVPWKDHDRKKQQLLGFMTGAQLSLNMGYEGLEPGNERNHIKKNHS